MNIVVGYTPNPQGLAAIDYATGVATQNQAKLFIVNTGERGNDSGPAFAQAADLDALSARLTGLGLQHEVHQPAQSPSAADEILKIAADTDADMIVIGLRRRSPVGKLFLGSISQQVILEADCPVVSVKHRD